MSTVLITGASRGLGLEFARQYAADGWRVIATARQVSPALEALGTSMPARVSTPLLDVEQAASVATLAESLGDEPVDVLINNAGYLGARPFANGGIEHQRFGNSDYEDWARTFRINVMGPMRLSEALVENVAASPLRRIITLTSMVGSIGLNRQGGLYPYRASKAAVNAIMKSMAIDLGKRGILAAAIHPGWAKTDMGGPGADITVPDAVSGVRKVIADLLPEQCGQVLAWDGSVLPA
ncbi:MAG: SDR family oxidoreductase [Chromatiales bacterium]|nr:SDR family oxidoreductase [Chromatiales bacterium]